MCLCLLFSRALAIDPTWYIHGRVGKKVTTKKTGKRKCGFGVPTSCRSLGRFPFASLNEAEVAKGRGEDRVTIDWGCDILHIPHPAGNVRSYPTKKRRTQLQLAQHFLRCSRTYSTYIHQSPRKPRKPLEKKKMPFINSSFDSARSKFQPGGSGSGGGGSRLSGSLLDR